MSAKKNEQDHDVKYWIWRLEKVLVIEQSVIAEGEKPMFKLFLLVVALLIFGANVMAKDKKVLIVVSSENKITLKDNVTHTTGFFLSELMVPTKALLNAGYEITVANPTGNRPVMDKNSDSAFWFGDVPGASAEAKAKAQRDYAEARALCERLRLCGNRDSVEAPEAARKLRDVIGELGQFAGVFFPGGHAPMEDLWKDRDVGTVLRFFHKAGKPTGLICHGPIALLASLANPESFIRAIISDDRAGIQKTSQEWIYKGYAMTIFTTREEQQEEPGQDNALGGYVKFYPDSALEMAGGFVKRADKWQSNVIRDRELVTGQNPFSDKEFARVFVQALSEL